MEVYNKHIYLSMPIQFGMYSRCVLGMEKEYNTRS